MSLFLLQTPVPPPRRVITAFRPPKPLVRFTPPRSLPASVEDLLHSLASGATHLPGVRSYENDLARLTLVGAVPVDQALTAAAADGGDAAREHLSAGMQTMVVETMYPGSLDEHSTISTRLFLPAEEVNGRAKKLRNRLSSDLLFGNASRNILAMTFRQVVFQHMWSIEIALFPSGTERDMEDLTKSREVPVYFTVSFSEDKLLATVAEVVCSFAFKNIGNYHPHGAGGDTLSSFCRWFHKPEIIASDDSSVCLTRILTSDIVDEAKKKVKYFNIKNWKPTYRERGLKNKWWTPPTYSVLDKVGGPGFSAWTNEHIPAYKIQIDGSKFKDASFQGWLKSSDNRWEVLLTHFQLVEFANILDMFYEDKYTLPEKQLSCGRIERLSHTSKGQSSKWKMVLLPVAWGCLSVSIGILAHFLPRHLVSARKMIDQPKMGVVSDDNFGQILTLGTLELEPLCISVVEKIKDSLGYAGEIVFDPNIGAWTGDLPAYFKEKSNSGAREVISSSAEAATSTLDGDMVDNAELSANFQSLYGKNSGAQLSFAQDIASYQVVFTNDGKVIGFQPTNRVAVNYWAVNPFAKLLYRGRKLSPGLLEPRLKIPRPEKIILVELLLSVNPKSWFALARQFEV